MPRRVVPILRAPRPSSESASSERWCGRIRWARSEMSRFPSMATPLLAQLGHLRLEGPGVDDHPRSHDVQDPGVEDPRRDQVEDELLLADDDRVAGVVAAVVARHHLDLRRQQVDDLPLALVAPLGAGDHDIRHAGPRSSCLRAASPAVSPPRMGTGASAPAGAGWPSKV